MALSNVVLIYNKYLIQLLTSLKDVDVPARDHVRSVLKVAGVLAIDHESSEYISINSGAAIADDSQVIPGITLGDLVSGVTGGHRVSGIFVALLDVLSATHAAKDAVLATQALRAIGAVQNGLPDARQQISAIFADDVQSRLTALMDVLSAATRERSEAGQRGEPDAGNAFMDALAGSSIANIAKEIADDLVDSDLLKDFGTDPSKIDFASLLDPTSKLGGVAKLVSTKLHDQLGSGKLDQGKLMGEVMSMFGKLNTSGSTTQNPLMSQVMDMAGHMSAAGRQKTRSRIHKPSVSKR